MGIKLEDLDKRICDYYKEKYGNNTVTNKETFREYIVNSENTFGIENQDLNNMSVEKLNQHLEFLDYLWES